MAKQAVLLLAHGTTEEVEKAKGIMGRTRLAEVTVYPLKQPETVGAAAR